MNTLDSQTTGIYLTATTDSFSSAQIFSSSSQVGKSNQDLALTLQIKNQIPINGKVYISFPYWNPDASGTQYTLQSYLPDAATGVTCVGVTNVAFNPTCIFDSSSQTLTLSSAFSGSSVAAGTTLSFKVKGFRNPITTQVVSGFSVYTGDATTGQIDRTSLNLQMTQVGQIASALVQTGVTTVQELTQYRIEFMVPVPLSQGCQLQLQFPSQITLDSTAISLVQAFGLPSTQRTLSGTIDKSQNSYFVNNACPSYRDNTNTAIIYFTNIQNPQHVLTSNSIEIYIYDSNGQMLVSTNGLGPTLTTTYGSIKIQSMSSQLTQINSLTTLQIGFQPLHALTADAQLIVYLPTVDLTVQSTCSLQTLSLLSKSAVCTTSPEDNSITITASFNAAYSYSSAVYIQFTVSQVKMPPSTAATGTVKVQTYTKSSVDGLYHLVDQATASNLIQATEGLLAYGIVTPTSSFANVITSYKFQFQVSDPILLGGYVVVEFPTSISIPTPASSACSNFVNFGASATCSIAASKITVTNGFDSAAFTNVAQELSFSVSGVQNPRSQQTTASFKVTTYAADGSLIDARSDQMTVTMTQTDSVASASVTPSNYVVGSVNTYKFAFKAPTPLLTGDYLVLSFPTSLNQPLSSTLNSCTGASSNIASSLSCSINGAYGLKVRLSFPSSTLAANTQFQFSVNSVANPSSGDPTSLFQAAVYDSNMYLVNANNPALSSFYVQMATGTQFPSISVSHQSSKPFIQTAFTVTFQLGNAFPANGQVDIKYPDQITVNASTFACTVSQFGASPKCTIDTPIQRIRVKQATNVNLAAGSSFTVTLQGMINSKYAKATDSFAVQTLTQDGYVINYAYNYLTVTNECDYPCYTCSATSASSCLSCDVSSTYSLLLYSQCIQSCPKGYYSTTGQCQQCDYNCAECSLGPKNCTKCATGLYNQAGICLSKCSSDQYVQDSTSMTCQPCASPCATCSSKVNYCTSCLASTGLKYLYGSFCYASCPASSYLMANNQDCGSCDSNCLTCLTSATTCTTCSSNLKLNQQDNTCVTECPPLITTDTGSTCTFCDPACKTCATSSPKKCLSCYSGLSLYSPNNTCLGQCPNGTLATTSPATSESVCTSCSIGCSLCQGLTDYCTKCDDSLGYLFFDFGCSKSCPSGYTRLNATKNVCVKINMDCPYGYAYNDFGVCELAIQKCEPGYVLNGDKTKCIPVPGGYAPIIFLIVCFGWTVFVLVRFRKTYSRVELITLLLVFYSGMQTLIYLVMMALSLTLDFQLLKAFHILTWASMYLLNCVFFVWFHYRLRKQDVVFRHWYAEHKGYYNIYKYVMLCVHFKAARLFYSKLLPKDLPKWPKLQKHHQAFDAAFSDRYHTLVKPLFYATVANFVVQVVPIVLMNIYGFVFITWGYQLVVMGVDHIVLAIVIFILEIIEFTHYKQLAIQEGNLLQPNSLTNQYLKKISDDNVMSVMEDNSMIGLNAMNATDGLLVNISQGPISLDEISKQIYRHEKGEKGLKEGPNEKSVLEKLIRKIREEQKFNRIYENDDRHDEQQIHDDFYHDIEKIGTTKQKYLASLVPDPPSQGELINSQLVTQPRATALDARERIENKLSYKLVSHSKGVQLTALQEQIYKDLMGQMFPSQGFQSNQAQIENSIKQRMQQQALSPLQLRPASNEQNANDSVSFQNQTLDLDDSRVILVDRASYSNNVVDSRTQEQQAIDSARTEKFYQEENIVPDKQQKDVSLSPMPSATDRSSKPQAFKKVHFQQEQLVSSRPMFDGQFGAQRPRSLSFGQGQLEALSEQGGLHLIDFDEPRRNVEEFHKFKREFAEKVQLIKDEQDDYKRFLYQPDWHSCDDQVMREWHDDMRLESDFDLSQISHVSYLDDPKKLLDAEYLARLELFRELLKAKYQYNNCYTQLTDPTLRAHYNAARSKNVTRRTQTYEKDIAIGYDPFEKDDSYLFLLKEEVVAELEDHFAATLFHSVLDRLSEEESFIQVNADTQSDGAEEDSDDFDFEQMKASKKRKKEVQFDMDDILGLFDIDDFGNMQVDLLLLRDNLNRRVNRNGYLVDFEGNVVNQQGEIVFEREELDEEEEIPMPYRFEKRKKQLLKQEDKFILHTQDSNQTHNPALFDLDEILQNEEEKIEEEFQKLRDISRPSSQDSMMGDMPNKLDNLNDNNLGTLQLNDNPNDPFGLDGVQFQDDQQSQADKRARDLAKAYGGKPPASNKKKSKKKKRKAEEGRLPTDRGVSSYLNQEEERVKRMAMLSYQIQNNNPPKPPALAARLQKEAASPLSDKVEEKKDFEQFFRDQMNEIHQYRVEAKQQFQQQSRKQHVPLIPPESNFEGQNMFDRAGFPMQDIQFYQRNEDNDGFSSEAPESQLRRLDSNATDQQLKAQQPPFSQAGSTTQLNQVQEEEDSKHNEDEVNDEGPDQMMQLIDQDAQKANRFFDRIQFNQQQHYGSALQNYSNSYGKQKTQTSDGQPRLNSQGGQRDKLINAQSNLNIQRANPQLNQMNQTQSAFSMSTIPLQTINQGAFNLKPEAMAEFQNTASQNLNTMSGLVQHNNLLETASQNPDDMNSYSHVIPQQQPQSSLNQGSRFNFYLPIQKNLANHGPQVKNKLQKNKEQKDVSFSLIGRMQLQGASNTQQPQEATSSRIKGLERVYLQKYPAAPKSIITEQAQVKKRLGGQFRSNTIGDQSQMLRTAYNNQTYNHPQSSQGANRQTHSSMVSRGPTLNKDLLEYEAGNQMQRQHQAYAADEGLVQNPPAAGLTQPDFNPQQIQSSTELEGWF